MTTKGVHGDFFAHALQPRASDIKDIYVKDVFKRTVISEYSEEGKTAEVESTFLDCPEDG